MLELWFKDELDAVVSITFGAKMQDIPSGASSAQFNSVWDHFLVKNTIELMSVIAADGFQYSCFNTFIDLSLIHI